MKKIILSLITAALGILPQVTYAAVGDIAGTLYTSDILTQIDGRDIVSYSIDGETLIALEDLEQYGFHVTYDDAVRTVFINQTGECPEDFHPSAERGTPGGTAGYYYESDICAYVNGCRISAYAIDGKMAAKVEDLGQISDSSAYGVSSYLMTYSYDDSNRLLSLYTKKTALPSVEEIKDDFKNNSDLFWFYGGEISIDGGCILIGGQSGTPHGSYTSYYYLGDDLLFMNITSALSDSYQFHDAWGRLRISDVQADGSCITFSGTTWDGRSGVYRLNPRTFEMTTLEESYNPDMDYEDRYAHPEKYQEPEPIGRNVYSARVNVTVDGAPVCAYLVEGLDKTFIEADIFEHLGYSVTDIPGGTLYMKACEKDPTWSQDVLPPNEWIGVLEESDSVTAINGFYQETFRVGEKILIDADQLRLKSRAIPAENELFNYYVTNANGISGTYDTGSNTLILRTDGVNADFTGLKNSAVHLYDDLSDVIQTSVVADNTQFLVTQYKYNDDKVDGFLIKSNHSVFHIGTIVSALGKYDAESLSVDGSTLIIDCADEESLRLDIDTMTFR